MAEAAFFDRILESTTTTGTGTLTLGGAITGYQTFAAVGDGNTTPMAIWEVDSNGNPSGAWETAEGCTYTSSGTTLTRGTFKSSSTGSAINFGAGTKRVSQNLPASIANQITKRSVAGADSDTSMAVNTRYNVDMSAWATADRTYTLPATAAVNDEVEIHVTAGDASHELIITAASGDTLAGISGGTEWSRLFITGERVLMRCTVANATWVIAQDGRIRQRGMMELTTNADGETAGTYTRPTQAAGVAGVWTSRIDNASIVSTTGDSISTRRACQAVVSIGYAPKDYGTAGNYVNARIAVDGTTEATGPSAITPGGGANVSRCVASKIITLTAGQYIEYQYRTQDGGLGAGANVNIFLSFTEVL